MRIVIIGASHSGISAAINLRKQLADCEIVLFEAEGAEGISFVGADGLLWISGEIDQKHMTYTSVEQIQSRNIDIYADTKVVDVNFEKQQVQLADKTTCSYDYLILACGSSAKVPDFAKKNLIDAPNESARTVQVFKTLADARNLKKLVNSSAVKIGIIGGGYIGVEVAEALIKAGKSVTLFQGSTRVLNTYYDQPFTDLVQQQLEQNDVKLVLGQRFVGFNELVETDQCDAYVLALGFSPNSDIGGSNIKRIQGAYDVDEYQETSVMNVFAIGDCAISYNNAIKSKIYLPIGSATARGASIVASTISNRIKSDVAPSSSQCTKLKNYGTQGSNALQVFGLNLSSTGVTYEIAKRMLEEDRGIEVATVNYTGSQLAPYLKPRIVGCSDTANHVNNRTSLDTGDIMIQIVYEKDNHRLLGAQVASYTDVVMANHLLSFAISQNLTVEELYNCDMFFLPQFNQLHNALRRCLQRVLY